jgi:hypothetical protein
MKISERLAKWAYAWNVLFQRNEYAHPVVISDWVSYDYRQYPPKINLCNLFWRTFVLTPALILAGLFLGTLLLLGARAIALEAMIFVIGITALVGLFMAGGHYFPDWVAKAIYNKVSKVTSRIAPVFKAMGRAKKEVCPIFEVEKSE